MLEKYFGEDTMLVILAIGFIVFIAIRSWKRGALEMLWTLLSWSGGSFAAGLAFRHLPTLINEHSSLHLDAGKSIVAGVICSVLTFAIVRSLIVSLIHRIFGPESHLGGWMYGGTGSIISILPSTAFILLVALLVRGTGTMFELESLDRIGAQMNLSARAGLAVIPTATRWRNSLEGLPHISSVLNLFDPVSTPARRNLAALIIASHDPTLKLQLRRSGITSDSANHPITVELVDHSPDIAQLVSGSGGEFKYFRVLRNPKLDQALTDNTLRKSLEEIDVPDEIRALVTGRSVPPRKKWLEKIFS